MGEVQGQGYVGQGLGFADVLAVVYKDVARFRPEDPEWVDRDRVLLSMGHYAIALYAALAEAGTIPVEELETYGSDDSRLPMSGMSTYTPGWRSPAARSATGSALRSAWPSDSASRTRLPGDQPDVRRGARRGLHLGGGDGRGAPRPRAPAVRGRHERAAGRRPHPGVLRTEPVQEKWAAFGWRTVRVDGNDIAALVEAFDSVPAGEDRPAVVICDTRIGSGVPFLESREKAHFMRIDENEWDLARTALSRPRAATPPEGN